MSIASELQNYNNGLLGAYNAVNTKGGTVPNNKNLTNLPNAIDSIPSGGGGTLTISADQDGIQGDGVITAYNKTTGVITGTGFGSSEGFVLLLDRDTHTYISQPTSSWSNTSITLTTPIDTSTIEGYTSICVVDANGLWTTKLMLDGDVAIQAEYGYLYVRSRTTGEIEKVEITDYRNSGIAGSVINRLITLGSKTFYSDDVVGAMINEVPYDGSGLTHVLGFMQNLNQPVKVPFNAWRYDNCMRQCTHLNQPVEFGAPQGGAQPLGQYFLANNTSFNQPITIPSFISTIGNRFLSVCYAFAQELEIPSTVGQISAYFLQETSVKKITLRNTGSISNNFMGNLRKPCTFVIETSSSTPSATNSVTSVSGGTCEAYTGGFTFKGTYRSNWLTAFPSTTASPWRTTRDGGA